MMASKESAPPTGLDALTQKDFSKEFHKAIHEDKTRQITNDAKMKAVTTAQSYDEYVGFVKTAHLKPINNLKMDELTKLRSNKFNRAGEFGSGRRGEKGATAVLQTGVKPEKPAETLAAFEKDWRRNCKQPQEKYDYITMFDLETMQRVFKVEIAFGLIGDVLGVFEAVFLKASDEIVGEMYGPVYHTLSNLASLNKFDFAADFMGKKEKIQCAEVFDKLAAHSCEMYSADDVDTLRSKFLKTT